MADPAPQHAQDCLDVSSLEGDHVDDHVEGAAAQAGAQLAGDGPVRGQVLDAGPERRTTPAPAEHGHMVAAVEEQLDDPPTDEGRAADDQGPHGGEHRL
ncbi:MAG: hypothetical protein QN122_02950 [Armatimonadota bacterium]|nr:hypothetical protein [Armatimonadota bacterium]MDR7447783.1 hypothetical protein [Armatimonadota bacterium]MDR7458562.1 hypothetical protein [Armatimonadota bacterium]MDR7479883.1 hypothetical protein [Armatimonadota bacterium]MDR7487769.1 hypothetical protein [Armatimonadota bacterium]